MKNSIEVINLSKSYKTKKAVNNISFKIDENEIDNLNPKVLKNLKNLALILDKTNHKYCQTEKSSKISTPASAYYRSGGLLAFEGKRNNSF